MRHSWWRTRYLIGSGADRVVSMNAAFVVIRPWGPGSMLHPREQGGSSRRDVFLQCVAWLAVLGAESGPKGLHGCQRSWMGGGGTRSSQRTSSAGNEDGARGSGILEMRRGLSASRQSPSVPMIRDAAIDGKKNREGRGYEGKCGRDKFPRWRAEVSARRLCVRNGSIGALTY